MSDERKAPLPKQIPFIIGNEACERFSFYGMRNILTKFLIGTMLLQYVPDKDMRELAAKDVFHTFVMGVYFFPLLGGWLSDRFFGKYNTILWFSLIYSVGQGCLAMFTDSREGFYAGLFLIALGSGGIKPLVASFVGDQFDQTNKHRAKAVFDAFYWSINFGSFFASLLMPIFLRDFGPRVAFGIPGVLMLLATIIFWAGRGRYIRVPPSPANPHSFGRVCKTAIQSAATGKALFWIAMIVTVACVTLSVSWVAGRPIPPMGTFSPVEMLCIALVVFLVLGSIAVSRQLEGARGQHPDEAVDGVRAVLRVLIVFALITPFWSLFDQKASTWVLQGNQMTQPTWFESSQMQTVNPGLVMILIPLNNLVVFPWLRKRGWPLTALGKMTVGMALAGLAWVVAGILQMIIDGDPKVVVIYPLAGQLKTGLLTESGLWIYWQIIPYILLTLAEVLVSATGLEFAYSQAPLSMKGVIMSFFNLTVTVGGLWVLLANHSVKSSAVTDSIASTGLGVNAFLMFFFAAFALITALAFRVYAKRYKPVDNYHSNAPAPGETPAALPTATAK
ncbi:MAG: oligopeptide:H+ symporter, partial [Vicinamibacterales bacterium]